jgi:Recombination, repair and ssDNA binding protein UvsY
MDLLNVEKIINDFQSELTNDIKMDELSIKEKAMLAPITKHKWVARTTQYKSTLLKLEYTKKQKIKAKTVNAPVVLSKAGQEQLAASDDEIISINACIDQVKVILEYLEKVEKLTGSLTYDYKNVIDLQKLETT